MFTGIIETTGELTNIEKEGGNVHFTIQSSISDDLKVDQSVSHDGVCLTVVELGMGKHKVTAVAETLQRSNLGQWKSGDRINLERAMQAKARLDGHIVQGHVDRTAVCTQIREADGSWYFEFEYESSTEHLLVDKGSICINGVSLTVVQPDEKKFSVAIIPYTFEHTNFQNIQAGDLVNLEFDIIGKYIARYAALYLNKKAVE